MRGKWSDERVKLLRRLWDKGLSCSRIAKHIGGISRSAVIGKIHRLGLKRREISTTPTQPPKRRSPKTPPTLYRVPAVEGHPISATPELEPVCAVEMPKTERVTILTLTPNNCRWPIGDPRDDDFHFCSQPRKLDQPYCDLHCNKAYDGVHPNNRKPYKPTKQSRYATGHR